MVSLDFFQWKKIIAATSNFQGMSEKNDSLLQIKETVRIYANSKYLDRNVQCVLFKWAQGLEAIELTLTLKVKTSI